MPLTIYKTKERQLPGIANLTNNWEGSAFNHLLDEQKPAGDYQHFVGKSSQVPEEWYKETKPNFSREQLRQKPGRVASLQTVKLEHDKTSRKRYY